MNSAPENAQGNAQQPGQPETVSVVIPCYNSKRFLDESVASIVNQTVPVEEIIIVDDASTDGSYEYAKSLDAKYPDTKIVVYQNDTNQGPGRSRNIGIAAASGDYVAFLDADDLWLPDKLERQLEFLRRNRVAAVVSEVVVTDENLVPFDVQDKSAFEGVGSAELACAVYLGKITMSTPTLVCRKSVLQQHGGFDEGLRLREDHALLIRLSLDGKLAVYAAPVVKRRAHAGSYSSGVSPLYKFRHEIRFNQTFREDFDLATVARARQGVYRTMIAHCFLIGEKRWALRFVQQLRAVNGQSATKYMPYYLLAVLPGATTRTLLNLRRNIKKISGVKDYAPSE
jgi:glycosyltransferase involved in cell wall biosynthesis